MNQIFEKSFYSLLLFILLSESRFFLNKVHSIFPDEYVLFSYPLNFITHSYQVSSKNMTILLAVFFLISIFFCILPILFKNKIFKILACSFFCVTFSLQYSYQGITHANHIWFISSFLMLFFCSESNLNSNYNKLIIRLIQSLHLSHYFISGLWKLRSVISSRFEHSLTERIMEYISYSSINPDYVNLVLEFFDPITGAQLLGFGFALAIIFQLSCILPIIFNSFFILYGVLTILFHISTGIVLNIYFNNTVLACLFLLILVEFMFKYEIKLDKSPVK